MTYKDRLRLKENIEHQLSEFEELELILIEDLEGANSVKDEFQFCITDDYPILISYIEHELWECQDQIKSLKNTLLELYTDDLKEVYHVE